MKNHIQTAKETTMSIAEQMELKETSYNDSFIRNWIVFGGEYLGLDILITYKNIDEFIEFIATKRRGKDKATVRVKFHYQLINQKGIDFCINEINAEIDRFILNN